MKKSVTETPPPKSKRGGSQTSPYKRDGEQTNLRTNNSKRPPRNAPNRIILGGALGDCMVP